MENDWTYPETPRRIAYYNIRGYDRRKLQDVPGTLI
jgi:hypothetical protein